MTEGKIDVVAVRVQAPVLMAVVLSINSTIANCTCHCKVASRPSRTPGDVKLEPYSSSGRLLWAKNKKKEIY